MNLRKEQILLLVVLVLGFLQYRSITGDSTKLSVAVRKVDIPYEVEDLAATPLVSDSGDRTRAERDWYRRPSETEPLPPRGLPFPSRPLLDQVALPLEPSPGPAHLEWISMDGKPVEGVSLGGGGEAPVDASDASGSDGSELGGGSTSSEDLAKTYDRVIVGRNQTWFGLLQHSEEARFTLDARKDFSDAGDPVRLQVYSRKQGRLTDGIKEFRYGAQEVTPVTDVILADTRRNQVGRRIRDVATGQSNIPAQEELLAWLLREAQNEAWVYAVASERAKALVAALPDDPRGYRWVERVLREQGDLSGLLALYEGIDSGAPALASFTRQGLGRLKELLGLWEAAEVDLQAAVDVSPGDPQALAALADHYLKQGRAAGALPLIQVAMRYEGQLETVDRVDVHRVRIGVLVALGMRKELETALLELPVTQDTWWSPYLKGVGQYILGDLQAAEAAFYDAGSLLGPAEVPDQLPVLAIAATRLRQQQWVEAAAAFRSLVDSAPLSRSQALGGLALVHAVVGDIPAALDGLDDALTVDPRDPWLHYMRGRCMRLTGEMDSAIEELKTCLELRDDFVAALHELAVAYLGQAEANQTATALVNAVRYMDRAVALDPQKSPARLLWQGFIRFQAGELRGARQSFQRVIQEGEGYQRDWAAIGMGIVEYAQGRQSLARGRLDALDSAMTVQNPLREHVRELIALIDDHAQKEQLWDRFARPELGQIWSINRDGKLGARIENEQVVFRGEFGRKRRASLSRVEALPNGGKFLAVEVDMEVLPGHSGEQAFTGLVLDGQGGTGRGLLVRLGVRDGKLQIQLEDGPRDSMEDFIPPALPNPQNTFHRLAVYTQPAGDTGNSFSLVLQVDGVTVLQKQVTQLRPRTSRELAVRCEVTGQEGEPVAVAFDNFRVERRK